MPDTRPLRPLVAAILVLATIVGVAAVFAVWSKRQVLETETWVETSGELLRDAEVQAALTAFVGDALFTNIDVRAELEERLPPQAQALAGPAAGGLRELTDRVTARALADPRTVALWEDANRAAHGTLLRIVEGEGDLVGTSEGVVNLDVAEIVERIGAQVGIDVAGRLPPEASSFEVMRSDELAAAQRAIDLLQKLYLVLPFLSLGLFGLAIYLARGRRRETVRASGWAFVAIGLIVLVVQTLAGEAVVGALAANAAVEPAVESTWEIGTSLLRDAGVAMVGYGLVIVLGAWLAGPGLAARASRRSLAPVMHARGAGYSALAAVVLLVFWWNPTQGTSRLLPSLVLIALMLTGFEILRRRTLADYPDETWDVAVARWRERARRWRGRDSASQRTEDDAAAVRLAHLERLANLREAGILSDDELAREKQRVLA